MQQETKKNYSPFVWSGNWWIEGNKAWFVSGEYNNLHCVDFDSQECEFEAEIPVHVLGRFRVTPRCIKYIDKIFCIPDRGECIWVYKKREDKLIKIDLINPNHVRLEIIFWWIDDDKMFIISEGLKQLFELDARTEKIVNSIALREKEKIVKRIMSEKVLYSLSAESNQISCFNLNSKKTILYTLPDIVEKVNTICFDGRKFWMSGYGKKLYIWDKNKNEIETIEDFPYGFGIYSLNEKTDDILDCKTEHYEYPTFSYSVEVGEYIWFIPYLTNKILYVSKDTYKMESLEIEDEIETMESLRTRNAIEGKYVLEYIRENRFIGIFSQKNRNIFEIDTKELGIKRKNFHFSYDCYRKMIDVLRRDIFYENKLININSYFNGWLEIEGQKVALNTESVGQKIYSKMNIW